MLWRREEAEYDVEEGEHYEAAAINRFRTSWYDLHLFTSFWRVTETTSSVHTFMKTPGAYGYARKCADCTAAMIEETILRQKQNSIGKTTVSSILADFSKVMISSSSWVVSPMNTISYRSLLNVLEKSSVPRSTSARVLPASPTVQW